jgi:hypothetical protein
LLLPLNMFRLREMLRLTRLMERSSDTDLDIAWRGAMTASRPAISGASIL